MNRCAPDSKAARWPTAPRCRCRALPCCRPCHPRPRHRPSQATHLPPSPERSLMRQLLPYAFARDHHPLPEDDGQQLTQRVQQAYAHAQTDGTGSAAAVVSEVESAADLSRMMQALPAVEDLLEASDDAPIIRMLNALLTQAAREGASDIHIEPYERHSIVRFRVDGTLREVVQAHRALHAALISRLKIMAELDIAEKRLPQDGRISLRIGGRAIDVRGVFHAIMEIVIDADVIMRLRRPQIELPIE